MIDKFRRYHTSYLETKKPVRSAPLEGCGPPQMVAG
jgi:hypothetical protein